MKHFLKTKFSKIHGAGGGPKSDPPPPPVLLPPKLGRLSSLSSYSYSESIDLLCEGPIEGLVNQRGLSLEGNRIFEGIYIDDVPIKKSVDPLNNLVSRFPISLEEAIQTAVSVLNPLQNLQNLPTQEISYDVWRAVNDPYKAWKSPSSNMGVEIIFGRKNIAKALFLGRNVLSRFADDSSNGSLETDYAKNKNLRFDAYSSFSNFENDFLKNYPQSADYPFFCIKINLGNVYAGESLQPVGEFSFNKYSNFYLEHDISNQVFEKYEISEIGKKRTLRPLSWVDMLYLKQGNGGNFVGGSVYLFGVHENGFPTEETISALTSTVKNVHLIDTLSEKYNYSNILAEIRNGEELQTPLGFFDKTYLDKQYGIKLLGPYSTSGQTPKITNFGFKPPEDGVIEVYPSQFEWNGENIVVTESERNELASLWSLQSFLLKNGDDFAETLTYSIRNIRSVKQLTYVDANNYSVYIDLPKSNSLFYRVTISRVSGVFSRKLERVVVNFNKTTTITDITSSVDNFKKIVSAAILRIGNFEGSLDLRGNVSYTDWSLSSYSQFDEEPNSLIHIIRNPNVSSVSVTMGVRALMDTAETTRSLSGIGSVQAGTKIPSIVKFRIEIGSQDSDGIELPPDKIYDYQIVGLAESPLLIDIGRTENASNLASYSRFIQGSSSVASALELPPVKNNEFRYVRVTRTTPETYSVLIRREISLEKITEIINAKFSYPNSAIAGIKLDSRNLSSLPPRSFDARLKRILVPSNYYPLKSSGEDKRLYEKASDLDGASDEEKTIYKGGWDGTFKESWSDNPAWILFDLLTNTRYGLGNFISPSQINIWELYRIGRFCDAVNDDGIFEGVSDGSGGLEPRYSCNVIIADKANAFDAIKNLTSAFRGNIFYSNSYIDFTDDRVKLPRFLFNNQNVQDGIFNYTNSRRDEQFNAIEVNYFDRADGFKTKTEYSEDPEDIKKRGVLRTSIDTFGVTSRAQANRIGRHILYSTINENQAVSFVCGPEILSCRPGDLISVEDDLKSLQKNIGRVLDIDYSNKILRLDEQFESGQFLNEVSLFIPTGMKTYKDYYDLSISPSKLAMDKLYANDVPQIATFQATGFDNLDYGCKLYLNQTGANISMLNSAQIGGIYSVTLSGLKQEIYKLTSVRESSPVQFEVSAIKFDTGKFGSIESGQNLQGFYDNYPNVYSPTQGESSIQQSNVYQLGFPVLTTVTTGNYDLQNDAVDIFAEWSGVNGATSYDYELITPRFNSITGRTTGHSVFVTDQTQAGRFTFKVSARNETSIPNPIGPAYSSGITVLSFSAPIRTNSVFAGISVKN